MSLEKWTILLKRGKKAQHCVGHWMDGTNKAQCVCACVCVQCAHLQVNSKYVCTMSMCKYTCECISYAHDSQASGCARIPGGGNGAALGSRGCAESWPVWLPVQQESSASTGGWSLSWPIKLIYSKEGIFKMNHQI